MLKGVFEMPKIYEKGAMIIRNEVGIVVSDSGEPRYELATTMGQMEPLFKSLKTGRTFHLSWEDIAELAADAGIDQEACDPRCVAGQMMGEVHILHTAECPNSDDSALVHVAGSTTEEIPDGS
jgi:hypothetical protein